MLLELFLDPVYRPNAHFFVVAGTHKDSVGGKAMVTSESKAADKVLMCVYLIGGLSIG